MPHIKNMFSLLAMYFVSLYVKITPTPPWWEEDNGISKMLLAVVIMLFVGYLEELMERRKQKSKDKERG